MALARMPTMGFSLNPNTSGVGSALGKVLAILRANGPYLEAYKAAYGIAPPGQLVTLSNGVQGHFTGEIDPAGGQPLFQIDFTPQAFADEAVANYNATSVGAPAPYPQPLNPPPPPPPSFPRAPSYPGQPGTYPGSAPPMAATTSSGAKPFLGIPPLALVAGGGLLIFLIARRQ